MIPIPANLGRWLSSECYPEHLTRGEPKGIADRGYLQFKYSAHARSGAIQQLHEFAHKGVVVMPGARGHQAAAHNHLPVDESRAAHLGIESALENGGHGPPCNDAGRGQDLDAVANRGRRKITREE